LDISEGDESLKRVINFWQRILVTHDISLIIPWIKLFIGK